MDDIIQAIDKLGDEIVRAANKPVPGAPKHRTTWAVVTATSTGPPKTVSLKIDGSSVAKAGYRYDASYTPTVNDTVFCDWYGTQLIVLGKLA